jgi:hypothetical protein
MQQPNFGALPLGEIGAAREEEHQRVCLAAPIPLLNASCDTFRVAFVLLWKARDFSEKVCSDCTGVCRTPKDHAEDLLPRKAPFGRFKATDWISKALASGARSASSR